MVSPLTSWPAISWFVWYPDFQPHLIHLIGILRVYLYGVIAKFLYPDSDEKHFHCVFTGLRLISSIAPTNLKYIQKTCE